MDAPAPSERGQQAAARAARALDEPDEPLADRILRGFCRVAAFVPLGFLAVLAGVMIVNAWPAIIFNGTNFFTGHVFTLGNLYGGTPTVHNGISAPHNAQYGMAAIIGGTLLTSIIALAFAIPIAVGGVLVLVERIPRQLQGVLGVFLELLAGIPSVVYGLWGLITFGPLLAHHVYPVLAAVLGWIPAFRGPVGSGQGLLTAGLILSLMIIPVIAATTRELLRTVPVLHKEGALAMGMTRYETVRVVTLPFVRSGIMAASLLGWARALGETIAVLMVSGNALNIFPYNIYAPVSTIAATIAATLDAALTDATGVAVQALAEAGLVLLAITLATNWAGRVIIRRTSRAALPVGRGL
ncbi:MAG: phosphate ABC transporter permease subunit PstC [Candidatus Dormibacteraeota bacterium]|nr:phosphate ABC transporter permease subunit PstC [Candidatus Dormibacteraeota bacterium]MBO0761734.1 phosphate ABC transporter permease subunit PstC [Candidatus Dormibacteraeota bacterium]